MTGDSQQRSYQVLFSLFRSNACKASHSRPTQNSHQHGFSLIVERVGCCDLVSHTLMHELGKPSVAQLTSGGFHAQLMSARISRHIG